MIHVFGVASGSIEKWDRQIGDVHCRAQVRELICTAQRRGENFYVATFGPHDVRCGPPRLHGDKAHTLAYAGCVVLDGLHLLPDARDLLASCRSDFPGLARRAGGHHVIVFFDHATSTLFLAEDIFGMYPLHYMRDGRDLLFSTSVDLLIHAAKNPLTFDVRGAAQFLNFHHCLGGQTFTEEIKRMPQGRILTFAVPTGRMDFLECYTYAVVADPRRQASRELAERIARSLRASVRRCLAHDRRNICLLSGGLDTRALCGVLKGLGAAFFTMTTYGDLGKLDDVICSRLVCEALEMPNLYVPLPADYLQRYWRRKAVMIDFATTMHTWVLPMSLGHGHDGAVCFDGTGGGAALQAAMVHPRLIRAENSGDQARLAGLLTDAWTYGDALHTALRRDLRDCWTHEVRRAVRDELAKFGCRPNAVLYFILANRTRRALAPSLMFLIGRSLNVVSPFLDRDLHELTMQVPAAVKRNGHLYRQVLDVISPGLGDILSSHVQKWPRRSPRRFCPRLATQSPAAFRTYLDQIAAARQIIGDLLEPCWWKQAKKAVDASAKRRESMLRNVQVLGELSLWARTYADKVRFGQP